jgi:hypothetical protein
MVVRDLSKYSHHKMEKMNLSIRFVEFLQKNIDLRKLVC